MNARPIIFSGPMIRALLDGSKTQTRRILTGNSPHGIPGDLLWVRETWAAPHAHDHVPPRLIPPTERIHYAATEDRGGLIWRQSIHMPRWASRITLEIASIRSERLHDITAASAWAEGVKPTAGETGREAFEQLWRSIHGAWAWEGNPWVWAITFAAYGCNVDELIAERGQAE